MAVGDAAAALGWSLVAGTEDIRNGWVEDNRSRDYAAGVKTEHDTALAGKAPTSHNHSAAQITSGVLAAARIPDLDAAKIATGTLNNSRTTATASNVANAIIARNADGVASVSDPTASSHIANRGWVLAQLGGGGADGPSSAAYNRNATGSGFYQVWMNSSLQFMRNTSSKRFKKNVRNLGPALSQLLQLRAVTYRLRDPSNTDTHVGMIAEEVAELFPMVVSYEDDDEGHPQPYGINYDQLVVPAIKAIQEQQALIERLQAQVTDLTAQVVALAGEHQ